MTPTPKPATDASCNLTGAEDLPDETLKISIDELVPFLNDFFAAMDAMRGPESTPGESALPGSDAA